MLKQHPDLESRLNALPLKIFSGKSHPTNGCRAVFFCYARPAEDHEEKKRTGESVWTCAAGDVGWYLYDLKSERILEEPPDIIGLIRSEPATDRRCTIPAATLQQIREKLEKHLKNSYLKKVQAPVGVKPVLKAWMELS